MRQLVPTFILRKLAAGEFHGDMTAAVMFVDLSGFSSMSDTLQKHGHHGSEMLAAVMRTVFEPLTTCIFAQSGIVAGYAGDALTAVFEEQGDGLAALRSVSAAVNIQRHFAGHPLQVTSFGEFLISVKIGLALGNVTWEIYQSADGQRATYCFRGEAVDGSAQAEHQAVPGESWTELQLHSVLGQHAFGEMQNGFFRLDELDFWLPDAELPVFETAYDPLLDHFFSDDILGQAFRGEFRPMVSAFIDIPANAQQGELLQTFMRAVFLLQQRYDCFFQCPGFGDKGANLLVFWGAPVAHENDIERALNFLLDLQRETGIAFSAGVSYRLAYAGFIGSALREDYTGYGWGISLAARIMKSAAAGEIWVDDEVARREKGNFDFSAAREQTFTGFAAPQKVYALLGRKQTREQVYRSSFEGREAEFAALQAFAAPLWNGYYAGTLLIRGEAGVGKSRLADTFLNSAELKAHGVKVARCQTDEIVRQALNPFRYWLRTYFGIQPALNEAETRERFSNRLASMLAAVRDDGLRSELARTALALGQIEQAREALEETLTYIRKDSSLEGADQPLRVYLNCTLALKELGDLRAKEIFSQGYAMLNARADGFADTAAREMFLDVPFHRGILEIWEEVR